MIQDPVLVWTIVGSASGAILGLAGTGGGIIAIPLLMMIGGYSVKDASAYGLLSLAVGAALSWIIRRKNTVYPVAAVLIIFAGAVAYLFVPLKTLSPPWVVIVLLNVFLASIACGFSESQMTWEKTVPLAFDLKRRLLAGS